MFCLQVPGWIKLMTVSADIDCGHETLCDDLLSDLSIVSLIDCEYKNPIYNRSAEDLNQL